MSRLTRQDGPTGLNYTREWGHNAEVQHPTTHRVTVTLAILREVAGAGERIHVQLPRAYEHVMSATLVGAYTKGDSAATAPRCLRITGAGYHPLFPSRVTGFDTNTQQQQAHLTTHSIIVVPNVSGFQARQLLGTWKDSNGVLPQDVYITQCHLDGSALEGGDATLVLDLELELARWV